MLRKLLAMTGCMLMLSTALAAQVGADAPERFNNTVTFPAENPCTGLPHDVTINFAVSIHEHSNNFVATLRRSGSTSDGYTMIAGTESFVANSGGERAHFMDMWRGPDGGKFRVMGNFAFNANTDTLQFDRFSLVCIGGGRR